MPTQIGITETNRQAVAYISVNENVLYIKIKNDKNGFIKELHANYENIIIKLCENIHPLAYEFQNLGSSEFITGTIEIHEKMAWFYLHTFNSTIN